MPSSSVFPNKRSISGAPKGTVRLGAVSASTSNSSHPTSNVGSKSKELSDDSCLDLRREQHQKAPGSSRGGDEDRARPVSSLAGLLVRQHRHAHHRDHRHQGPCSTRTSRPGSLTFPSPQRMAGPGSPITCPARLPHPIPSAQELRAQRISPNPRRRGEGSRAARLPTRPPHRPVVGRPGGSYRPPSAE